MSGEPYPGLDNSVPASELPLDETQPDFVFENPVFKSATSIEFQIEDPEGLELRPGHSLGFMVPEQMRGRLVRDVILQHRKGEKYRDAGSKEHDPHGAYSRVELHDQESGDWVGWRDPKGYSPDKYAEWRPSSDPENEVLHDWLATVGEVKPDAVRVTNVGQDEQYSVSQIHGVEVVFYPELENVVYEEKIYTSGTEFMDIEQGKLLPSYGGGSNTEGVYAGAVALGGHGADFELCTEPGPGVEIQDDRMLIDLEAGRKLIQAEIAAGDTEHLDAINPKTGRHTRLGWAKLWVGIQHAESDEVEWFVPSANVPPQGVIAGGPALESALVREGDKLVVQSSKDAAYIMGWRLAYEQSEQEEVHEAVA